MPMGDGTYLRNGINAAVKMFEATAASGETNVILLFTDGENHSKPEELQAAIDAAKKVNAIFIIVGIGSTKPSFIPLYDGNNKPVYKRRPAPAYHMMSRWVCCPNGACGRVSSAAGRHHRW